MRSVVVLLPSCVYELRSFIAWLVVRGEEWSCCLAMSKRIGVIPLLACNHEEWSTLSCYLPAGMRTGVVLLPGGEYEWSSPVARL
jgi:hypothetical protein